MIEFRALGTLDLKDGRELDSVLAQPKRVALFAYLTLARPRGFHLRDKLVGVFWPEADVAHARNALSQALHFLRRGLGNDALATRGAEEIGIAPDQIRCDALAFESALDAGQIEQALELYGGELLPGLFLSDCPEFERWLEGERARLRERAVQAAAALAENHGGAQNGAQAARWLRQAASWAPYDESILRQLVQLLDEQGDRATALREYEAFAQRLVDDLELEPAPETTALIASVRARQQANGGVLPSAPLAKQPDDAGAASVTTQPRPLWRTRHLAAGALVALGAVAVAGATVIRNGRADALDPTRVLVDIFQNQTGDPSLDHLGRMATDRVTAGLTLTSFVDVVSLGTRLLSREPVVPDTELLEQADLQALARANGTGTVVSGSYYLQGDSVHFLTHVTDAGTGEELATLEPVVGAIDAPVAAVEQLRDRVMTTLATLTDPRLAKWMRYASQPPTFEAYQAFAEGMELQTVQGKWSEAIPHYLRAAALDSTFTMASLWAASADGGALSDSINQALNRRRGQLAPLDRLWLDYQLAWKRGDYERALEAARRFVEIAPGSEFFLYKAASAARRAGHPREAIGFLTQADPESGWLRGWYPYWGALCGAYHFVDHRKELEAARRGRRLFPVPGFRRELRALAALGRVEELNTLVEEYEARVRAYPEWRTALYNRWETAADLRAHGYPVAASNLADGGIERFKNSPPDWTREPLSRHLYARLLFLTGRLDESRPILEGLLNEDPYRSAYLNLNPLIHLRDRVRPELAAILARQGHPEEEILEAVGLSEGEANPKIVQAAIAAQQGELERAVRMLPAGTVPAWHYYTMFEPLWDYPPFQELVRPKG